MKKIIALIMAAIMALSLIACAPATEDNKSEYKVAMVTDYGDITDQSFNQTTWEAVVAFGQEHNIETKYYKPTTNDTASRVASVELAIADGYNVIVLPGYAFGATIAEVSGEYPEVKFIALDVAKGDLLEGGVPLKGEQYDYNPDAWDLSKYEEIVFCGYGEPTERLNDLLEVAKHIRSKSSIKIRINTNGLADLIWKESTAPKLEGLIDTVSVSLNATNKDEYLKVVRPKFGIESYDAMLKFTKDCTKYVPSVVMTVVDIVTSPEEQELCKKICESVGATLRVRPYIKE